MSDYGCDVAVVLTGSAHSAVVAVETCYTEVPLPDVDPNPAIAFGWIEAHTPLEGSPAFKWGMTNTRYD